MKRSKRLFALLLMVSVIGTSLATLSYEAKAEDTVLVILNNQQLNFGDVSAQIIDGRTMVPYRALGDALDATTKWDAEKREVEMVLGSRYVRLEIGNDTLTYGNASVNGFGDTVYETENQLQVEGGVPIIVNDRTLVPLRVISESFGATVQWVGASRTVFISTGTEEPEPTSTPAPVATPTPVTVRPEFMDTDYFQEVSGQRLQTAYQDKQPISLFYYDSKDQASMEAILKVKSAGAATGLKVYGFDVSSTQFASNDKLKWIYEKVSTTPTVPSFYVVYDDNSYAMTADFENDTKVKELLEGLDYNMRSGATPTPGAGSSATPTPSPGASASATATPTPTPTATSYAWNYIPLHSAMSKFAEKEMFIYVYYNSIEDEMYWKDRLDVIQEACKLADVKTYYTDAVYDDPDMEWWAWEYVYNPVPNPTIFLLTETGEVFFYERPTSVETLAEKLKEFKEKYYYY